MEVLYIGAGKDIEPIHYLKKYNNFIFIDSQPYSEYGSLLSSVTRGGYNGFSRPNFINELNIEMNEKKFKLDGLSENLNIYKKNYNIKSYGNKKKQGKVCCKKIHYYYNTPLPLFNHKIKNEIKNIKLIIVKGYDPDYSILRNIYRIDFLGHYETIYHKEDIENKNSIINQLHINAHFRSKFNNFYYITKKNELKKFNRWDKFYNNYLIDH